MDREAQDLLEEGLGDYFLIGFRWVNEGRNLILDFDSPDDEAFSLKFVWVSRLEIDMEFGEFGGVPLLWESKFQRQENKSWLVDLDFGGAPKGGIQFNCDDVELVR